MYLAIVLTSLVSIADGRWLQNAVGRLRRSAESASSRIDQLKMLEMLLFALSPRVAFWHSNSDQLKMLEMLLFAWTPRVAFRPSSINSLLTITSIEGGRWSNSQMVAGSCFRSPCDGDMPWSENDFMIYGLRTDPLFPGAEDHPQGDQANMYCVLVDGTNITGRRVLEIGSRRGGGARLLHKYHKPACYVGLDPDGPRVAIANKHFSREDSSSSLVFLQGQPCRIPFPDNSFDVVINVEGSHNYGPFRDFLEEVRRVLVPGGKFLIEDFRDCDEEIEEMQEEIEDVFGTSTEAIDITENIVTDMNYIRWRIEKCSALEKNVRLFG